MSSIVNLYIGQAGVQIGEKCWQMYCDEHLLSYEGTPIDKTGTDVGSRDVIFYETATKWVPKSIFIDTEPSVVGALKNGSQKNLHNPSYLLHDKECASDNYAIGVYGYSYLVHEASNRVRQLVEKCSSVQAIQLHSSISGGTGSGFCARLIDILRDELLNKKILSNTSIIPSRNHNESPVSPYNALLAIDQCLKNLQLNILLDNETIYKTCDTFNIKQASFPHLNQIIASSLASITSSMRFSDQRKMSFNQLPMNLVLYPHLNYVSMRHTPHHDMNSKFAVNKMLSQLYSGNCRLSECDFENGLFLSSALLCRGDLSHINTIHALRDTKINRKKLEDIERSSPKVKVSPLAYHVKKHIDTRDIVVKKSTDSHNAGRQKESTTQGDVATEANEESLANATLLTNHSSIASTFEYICNKAKKMLGQKAFLHWYLQEGIDEPEIVKAHNNTVYRIISEYRYIDKFFDDDSSMFSCDSTSI